MRTDGDAFSIRGWHVVKYACRKAELKRGLDKGKEAHESAPARKVAKCYEAPVPQTDTGRREENSKTNGRTLVKELGKMTP